MSNIPLSETLEAVQELPKINIGGNTPPTQPIEPAEQVAVIDIAAEETIDIATPAVEESSGIAGSLGEIFQNTLSEAQHWMTETSTYLQFGVLAAAFFIASTLAPFFRNKVKYFKEVEGLTGFWWFVARTGRLLFPIFLVVFFGIAGEISNVIFNTKEVCEGARRVAVIYLAWTALKTYITNPFIRKIGIWTLTPIAILSLFGQLGNTADYLDSVKFETGDISISVLMVLKAIISAGILFWLGRISSDSGQKFIREQEGLEISTKELLTKLFEILVYVVIFVLLMQVVGIDLTALAIVGGAVGVGIGFGLQNIASNFISGMILLFEGAITKEDVVELDDGTFGVIEKVGSRSALIHTFDGKEIMVPNEDFITSRVTNWSHISEFIRYEVEFGVSYDSDPHEVRRLIEEAVAKHPAVRDDHEEPEVEMKAFGESSIDFCLEFWAEGADERKGQPSFVSDVMFIIWDTLKANNIKIPYPQRDVHIKSGGV